MKKLLNVPKKIAQNEPVLTTQVLVGFFTAVILTGVSLNAFELSAEQVNTIIENLPQLIIGAVSITGVIGGLIARQFVTPTNKL